MTHKFMTHKFTSILLLAIVLCACKDKTLHRTRPSNNTSSMGSSSRSIRKGTSRISMAQKIEGWMDAMTMDYPVKDQAGFDTLHVGDHITATVYVQDLNYWLGEIHHVR